MTVRDREEEHVLHSLLSRIQRQHQDRALKVWIGLKLPRGNCVLAGKALRGFKWESGEENSHYSNWEREPVTTCTEERCVKIHHTSGQDQLKWTDAGCKSTALYACKFYFVGMCKALTLLGPGKINYTLPFSKEPERSELQLFPFGTYADIVCSDQQSHYSFCSRGGDDIYRWNVPGPFCKIGKQNCSINNGGCEHLCQQEGDEVRCACKQGYDLDDDGLTCRIRDVCKADTCEHRCVMEESGHSCKCRDGFQLDANLRNCSDIDECESQVCEQHLCVNTHGSYTCMCKDGYEMVDGKCNDTDECHSCDVTETSAASTDDPAEEETQENFIESLTRTTVELQHQSPQTDAPLPDLRNVTLGNQQSNISLMTTFASSVNSRVLICVLGSVIPLLFLVTVTLAIAIYRCNRSKKEAKKNTTADGYCWVSSGLDPRLEKLYESILTDDL